MFLKINKKTDIQILLGEIEMYFKKYNIEKTKKMEIKTIISEIVYNIKKYTPQGSVQLTVSNDILHIEASDKGDGIENFDMAIRDGYSTSGTLGLGFASLFRLSDEVDIQTSDEGTTIDIKKRLR
ncbi:MAG: hypothetical protein KAJ49_01200 [Arcobacteraceae bacterium]|nr:hypothetical protein [Arcobacteraceae bacterium]